MVPGYAECRQRPDHVTLGEGDSRPWIIDEGTPSEGTAWGGQGEVVPFRSDPVPDAGWDIRLPEGPQVNFDDDRRAGIGFEVNSRPSAIAKDIVLDGLPSIG